MREGIENIPANLAEIEEYTICDKSEIVKHILSSSKCYFYDCSAFRNHMKNSGRQFILQYIKKTQGIVILIKSVLMELCTEKGELWEEHIEYIKEMKRVGLLVFIINEEDVVEVLQNCFSSVKMINMWLSYAVKNVKSKYGAMELTLRNDLLLKQELLVNYNEQDRFLGRRFFEKMRREWKMEANLGEEMIAVCLHMLSHIPEYTSYKYIALTDDKGAVRLIGKVMEYINKMQGQKNLSALTSASLCQRMLRCGILMTEEEIRKIVEGEKGLERISVYCSGEYELYPDIVTMTSREFAEKVVKNEITVYM